MRLIISLLLALTLIGCKDKTATDTKSTERQPSPPASSAPTASGPALSGAPQITVTGTVLETIDVPPAGMYMRLKTPNGEIWAAVGKANVEKGSEVTVINATPMDGFESKALQRRFDRIVFGVLATGTSPAAAPSPSASGSGAPVDKQAQTSRPEQHPAPANPPVSTDKIKVKKAEGVDGKTIAEVFAAKATLKDTPVAVRGKVVKYNPGIMGKNWIHLRDGSGSPENKNDDLTVTTSDSAAVGDIVVVRGVVHLDRDFGAGYAYPVIIEDAKVSK